MRTRLVLTLTFVLTLAACAGNGGDIPDPAAEGAEPATAAATGTAPAQEETGGEDEPGEQAPEDPDLTLGLLPIVDVAPVYIALEDGLFEREGLSVAPEFVQGGAAAIPAIVSGDLDLTFGAYPSFFIAIEEGLDLRLIADQIHAVPEFGGIYAMPDAGIEDAADLQGRRVAVNTLNNLGEMLVRSVIREAGGDPQDVELIEVPFPDMVATLERGDVDAIWVVEPFGTIAQNAIGATLVADTFSGPTEGLPVAGYQVTAQYAEQNPSTIAAFQRAIIEASRIASENPDRVAAVLPEYTALDEEAASQIVQPEYVAELNAAEVQRVVDLMAEFGLLSEAMDVQEIFIPTP